MLLQFAAESQTSSSNIFAKVKLNLDRFSVVNDVPSGLKTEVHNLVTLSI
jgi:hypothetical protein